MEPLSFTCDYNEGAHPLILQKLLETNMKQEPGYGEDSFSASAREKIRAAIGRPKADVFFLVGGTQTNATVIDALLHGSEGVIAAATGHIAVHEAGAVEFCGHKVITLPQREGRLAPETLEAYMKGFYGDPTWPHMVSPGMVYVSFPTEYGTLYSKSELQRISGICKEYGMKLFLDGARLGYGLMSEACEVDLRDISSLCDVFYIGGTKVGALCGEAVVFPGGNAPRNFFSTIKQHGALLAKGRLTGIQFDTLFTDGLYLRISKDAITAAMRLKAMLKGKGIPLYIDSPTNQQFPILTDDQMRSLEGKVLFEVWEKLSDGRSVTRFATSWATPIQDIERLAQML